MSASTRLVVRRALLTRSWSAAGIFCASLGAPAWALKPRADSPTVAIDPLLVDTGLAARWGAAMRRDLGWAAQWEAAGSSQVLERLESGDVEAGIFLSHPRASQLEQDGLIHDRRRLARTEVWLVGPADDPAGIRTEKDPARAIAQVLAARAAGVANWELGLPGEAGGQQDPDSPLAQLVTQLAGQTASSLPRPSRPRSGSPSGGVVAGIPTYRLVTQAAWLRQGAAARASASDAIQGTQGRAKGTRIWFQGHPALVLHAEVARSFRAKHPGGRLLVDWLDRPLARSALRGATGWQNAKG